MKKTTKAVATPYQKADAYGALSMPVYNNVSYEFPDAKTMADTFCRRVDMPEYARMGNPTTRHFEDIVKNITGAANVIAFNSGMSAIADTFLAVAAAGKNIVTSRHLFGNTYSLFTQTLRRFGVETRFADLTDPASVEALMDDNTCAVFVEILTNPQMEVADTQLLAQVAHRHHAMLIADTTMIPFTEFDGKAIGIDVQVVSSTKYITGGATTLGGLVIDHGNQPGFGAFVKAVLLPNCGAYLNPQSAYMLTIGLETLHARYRMQSDNALAFATALCGLPQIKAVHYTGLPDHAGHQLFKELYGGSFGAMVCIELESKPACFDFLNRLRLIRRATNLFDNRTLALHPASSIAGLFSPRRGQQMDVKENLIRLSVGLEDVADLVDDVRQALQP